MFVKQKVVIPLHIIFENVGRKTRTKSFFRKYFTHIKNVKMLVVNHEQNYVFTLFLQITNNILKKLTHKSRTKIFL